MKPVAIQGDTSLTLPMNKEGPNEIRPCDLKTQGNAAFVAKNYPLANELYTNAMKICDGGSSSAVLYGNRSAARYHLGKYEEALHDAEKATESDATWAKGFFRKGSALEALRRFREAQIAFEEALKLDPKMKALRERIAVVKKIADKDDRESSITSREHWILIYRNISDIKLRLGTLVILWNKCTPQERYAIFLKFLQILAGESVSVNIAAYTPSLMLALPDGTYEDIHVADNWVTYFHSLELPQKVTMFQDMYASVSKLEQNLIVKDMRTFILCQVQLESTENMPSTSGGGQDLIS